MVSLRFLLDTCFLSDLVKIVPPPGIKAWSRANNAEECAISVMTIGEIRHGINLLPEGGRRTELRNWLARDVIQRFADRTVDITVEIAEAWAGLTAQAHRTKRSLSAPDGLILATAIVHRLSVVTRNVRDFSGYDVPIVNPWDAGSI
ncbi:MAG TPA: type II toxin-antitoxin system VapC family toxin [Gemmatimonadaceae bacterium]|nr:type II toxin-antitoxin system VapC family toxin [Gemmatimonadaceae bacterium]